MELPAVTKAARSLKGATRANVKTIVLSHFLPATDPKDEYERLGEQVNKHFAGRVLVAKDLMEF